MEPILSKDEIAELISAIKSGEVSVDTPSAGEHLQHPTNRPAQEISLFQVYRKTTKQGEARIPNFDIVVDMFARNFGTSLTNILQRSFTVVRSEITTTTFQQSLNDLNNQGAIGIFSTTPLKYGCLVHFDNFMAFTLLEIMLGSSMAIESITLDRSLTTIEVNILKNTMQSICQDFGKAIHPVVDMTPSLTKVENNFRLVNIVDAEAEVLVASFEIQVAGEKSGKMRFIIPYLTLEPYREEFREMVTVTQAAYGWRRIIYKEAMEMTVTIIARSGLIDMTIGQVLDLKKGDIVDLGYNPDRPLHIVIEKQPKFFAIPGESNGKKAFHITRRYNNSPFGEANGSN
ncbi:MAG: hypothetical protein CSA32_02650 [Desulfobulbus propionicus]|nr:MAG: hypothetical protein CSA32_02650 [Desulfobulbus propionicus]